MPRVSKDAPNLFREGGPLVGELPASGLGTTQKFPALDSLIDLEASRGERNRALVASLRESAHSQCLLELTQADALLGWMTGAVEIDDRILDSCNLASRFAVEQSSAASGMRKIKPCDDETACGTNGCCRPSEKLANDSMGFLVECAGVLSAQRADPPVLWKLDIHSAYRRIPIRPDHRWLAWVVFMVSGCCIAADHICMPFGAIASVHAWNRMGAFLCHIGRRVLLLTLLRYVDDFFAIDRAACAEHAMGCFARVVRALLGPNAVADRKMSFGNPLPRLGLTVKAHSRSSYVRVAHT